MLWQMTRHLSNIGSTFKIITFALKAISKSKLFMRGRMKTTWEKPISKTCKYIFSY